MEADSVVAGDLDSICGGPFVDKILVDAVSQQQGWLRIHGKIQAVNKNNGSS